VLAGIAEFELELLQERIRSGIATAKARGKRLGRQPGHRPKSDRLVPKVMALVAKGRSYRRIGREVGLSENTVADIVKRYRAVRTQAT
jgi:DNA invertase Pin-like site-specific DNA recombinase